MFTLPSLGLNTLKTISANRVPVASCFLKSPKPCRAGKYSREKSFLVSRVGLFVPALGGSGSRAMRCSTGIPQRGRGDSGIPAEPGPAAAAAEIGSVPPQAGGGSRGRRCPGPGPARAGGRPRRRRPAGSGSAAAAPGGSGAGPGAALPRGTRQVGRGAVRGAGSAGNPGSAGAAAGTNLHPECGSAPPCLSKIAGAVTNTLQVKQAGGEDHLKAF